MPSPDNVENLQQYKIFSSLKFPIDDGIVPVNAFAPINRPASTMQSTALEFGFLKDLGLEKPSWLPDFGSKKEDEAPAAEAAVD